VPDFHPGNFQNLKRVWEAEQKRKAELKREKVLEEEHRREQSIYEAK
jgi:hypothetical protein